MKKYNKIGPGKRLTDYKLFAELIPKGEANAIKKKDLYTIIFDELKLSDDRYMTGEKKLDMETYKRSSRYMCEKARKNKILLINSDKGLFICKDVLELEEYIYREMKKIRNYVTQFSILTNKSVPQFIREKFFPKTKPKLLGQQSFLSKLIPENFTEKEIKIIDKINNKTVRV